MLILVFRAFVRARIADRRAHAANLCREFGLAGHVAGGDCTDFGAIETDFGALRTTAFFNAMHRATRALRGTLYTDFNTLGELVFMHVAYLQKQRLLTFAETLSPYWVIY